MYLGEKIFDKINDNYRKNPHLRLKVEKNGFIDFKKYDKLVYLWKAYD